MKNLFRNCLICLLGTALFFSCKSKEEDDPTPTPVVIGTGSNNNQNNNNDNTDSVFYFEGTLYDTAYRFETTKPDVALGMGSAWCRIREFPDDFYSGVDFTFTRNDYSYDDLSGSEILALEGQDVPMFTDDAVPEDGLIYADIEFQTPYYMQSGSVKNNNNGVGYLSITDVKEVFPDLGYTYFTRYFDVTGTVNGYVRRGYDDETEIKNGSFRIRLSTMPD